MQVKAITPRGYCKGVVRAIEIAKNAQNEARMNFFINGKQVVKNKRGRHK